MPNCMNIYFRKSDSSTDDGQKIIRGITEPELTTVDRRRTKACRRRQKAASRWATKPKVGQRYTTVVRNLSNSYWCQANPQIVLEWIQSDPWRTPKEPSWIQWTSSNFDKLFVGSIESTMLDRVFFHLKGLVCTNTRRPPGTFFLSLSRFWEFL